jgi:hypothetical protein
MNNKNLEVSCLTGWSASVPAENLTPKVLTEAAKMLHTSRLYLREEATRTEFDLKPLVRTAHSNETLIVQ